MAIDYTHKDSIEAFISDNINEINSNIKSFSSKDGCKDLLFDGTDIKRALKNKYLRYIKKATQKEKLWKKFVDNNYDKSKIKEIASDFGLYFADVQNYYHQRIFEHIESNKEQVSEKWENSVIDCFDSSTESIKEYVKNEIKSCLDKSLFWFCKDGFSFNLKNTESGLMTANAGDSAQFMFLSRAILAGFNCSNVDVRSSRYDAVIDKNGKILRVQIKGISNNQIQFKDRDRGGRGIDPSNERNQGKRISTKDCELYVAVDKQFGICYIIPVSKIVEWDKDSKSINDPAILPYKENWEIIYRL